MHGYTAESTEAQYSFKYVSQHDLFASFFWTGNTMRVSMCLAFDLAVVIVSVTKKSPTTFLNVCQPIIFNPIIIKCLVCVVTHIKSTFLATADPALNRSTEHVISTQHNTNIRLPCFDFSTFISH